MREMFSLIFVFAYLHHNHHFHKNKQAKRTNTAYKEGNRNSLKQELLNISDLGLNTAVLKRKGLFYLGWVGLIESGLNFQSFFNNSPQFELGFSKSGSICSLCLIFLRTF